MIETLKMVFSDKSLKKNRSLFVLAVIVMVLGFLSVSLAGKAAFNYHHSIQVKNEIAQMEHEIAVFKEKNYMISSEPFRPVAKNQVDYIQADILLAIQGCGLKMVDYKAIAQSDVVNNENQAKSNAFEVSFKGSYENTIKFLRNFSDKDALLNLMYFEMSPKDGIINTNIYYKIYIK